MSELKEATINFILVILFLSLMIISLIILNFFVPDFNQLSIYDKLIVFFVFLIELLFTIITVYQVRNWFKRD
jgi:hypothetical protein